MLNRVLSGVFQLSKYSHAPVLVEVTWNPFGGLHTDYLTIVYALLPSTTLPKQHSVYVPPKKEESLACLRLLTKDSIRETVQLGWTYGRTRLARQLGDFTIDEPSAVLYRTQFPSNQPIIAQAYQLIAAETHAILGGNHFDWHFRNSQDEKMLDRFIDFHWRPKG